GAMSEYHHIEVRPLTPHLGAEIFGIDLARVSAASMAEIHTAFARHSVLVFRDQDLTRDQHKAFGLQFGALHVHPSHRLRADANPDIDPEIFHIKTTPDTRHANGEAWHTDLSCEPRPPLGSLLYVRTLPGDSGGDTLFANLSLAYDALSEPIKRLLAPLTAFHDGRKDLRAYNVHLRQDQDYPAATHPVVTRHPNTGLPVLYVNRSFTESIDGLRPGESAALLEMLWRHVDNNPRFHARVRWQPGTLTLWDNRNTWHHAVWDYYPATRIAERVTIAADSAPEAFSSSQTMHHETPFS
ncbi:MAG: TauD/TfdA dioxygenase family protein, partial [Pseudomonadales bacterium]